MSDQTWKKIKTMDALIKVFELNDNILYEVTVDGILINEWKEPKRVAIKNGWVDENE